MVRWEPLQAVPLQDDTTNNLLPQELIKMLPVQNHPSIYKAVFK